ncbi:MAG: recombinase family protein [Cyclobacteriaceae bacterium]|nr:recombinase family protein [Cyclobacteriaceae bacterium]
MKIGYARVSTKDQKLEMQLSALAEYGCEEIFEEKQSAVKVRPQLDKALEKIRKGDVFVVWKIDRLARSLKDLINLVTGFKEKGVGFISLNDKIDTTTAQGRLIFNLFGSFAEFEREIISERTRAGLAEARKHGRTGGRPPGISQESKKSAWAAYHLSQKKELSVKSILAQLKMNKASYYRYIAWAENESKKKVTKTKIVTKKG